MAGIDVGGDSSVEWKVVAGHFRVNNPPTGNQDPGNGAGWIHHGIDETEDPPGNFTICIEIPDARQAFFSDLQNRIADSANRPTLCFDLPIVANHNRQIRITWNSRRVDPAHLFASAALKEVRAGATGASGGGGTKKGASGGGKKKGGRKKGGSKKGGAKKGGKKKGGRAR